MTMTEKICIKIAEPDSEEIYFRRQEEEKIRALHEASKKEADENYRTEHKNHCFRCGTLSLVEIEHGSLKIDVCANKGCGAVHLDPGELEMILAQHGKIKQIHKAIMSVFK